MVKSKFEKDTTDLIKAVIIEWNHAPKHVGSVSFLELWACNIIKEVYVDRPASKKWVKEPQCLR